MSRGASGRIVLEISPTVKHDLYSALAQDGLTLKDWFLQRTYDYLDRHQQPALPFAAESRATYDVGKPGASER